MKTSPQMLFNIGEAFFRFVVMYAIVFLFQALLDKGKAKGDAGEFISKRSKGFVGVLGDDFVLLMRTHFGKLVFCFFFSLTSHTLTFGQVLASLFFLMLLIGSFLPALVRVEYVKRLCFGGLWDAVGLKSILVFLSLSMSIIVLIYFVHNIFVDAGGFFKNKLIL